jgi:hypothetical protein
MNTKKQKVNGNIFLTDYNRENWFGLKVIEPRACSNKPFPVINDAAVV